MVLYVLQTKPELFNNYLAIYPSLWWDDQFVLKSAENALLNSDLLKKQVFIGIANTTGEADFNEIFKIRHMEFLFDFEKEMDVSSKIEFIDNHYSLI